MIKILQLLKPVLPWLFYVALAVITILLLIPLAPIKDQWKNTDKLEHISAFAGLTLMGALSFEGTLKKIAICLMIYGASTEILQALTPARQASFADWLADCVGIGLGIAIYRALIKRTTE